ncbi:MAG: hypothetical protein JWM78_1503 [Verrucomicrobiaceae bacterium]|nr:hypothetical protein [Verrucomicrobiaceae bacterium]
MASYIEGALINDEKIIYTAHISLWSLAHLIILGTLTIWLVVGLVFLIMAYIRYKTTEIAITNKRVIAKFGFIRRQTIEMYVQKVETIQVDQTIFGRIFNFGTLVISGAGNPQEPVTGISNPLAFRRAFLETQDRNESSN